MSTKLRIFLPLTYMLGIYVLSSIPNMGSVETQVDSIFQWVSPELQNLLHIPLYGGLAGCWYWALKPWLYGVNRKIKTAFILTIINTFFAE